MMKKSIATLLVLLLTMHPLYSTDPLTQHQKNTDALYRQGAGAEDGGYSAISLSMFGWGVGLVAGIAVLAAVLHQSKSGHNHSDSSKGQCH
ncbi:MAG: hypothetical protein HYX48_06160 [Chlamydiales bacterium]|nr:hypothetical protein [Chlamydiales bacterium]